MSYQHQLDARIDDVQIHSMIGDGWECIYIRAIMGIIHSVCDVKNYVEIVDTEIAQCRAPCKGDIGSNPMIGIMFYLCFVVFYLYFLYICIIIKSTVYSIICIFCIIFYIFCILHSYYLSLSICNFALYCVVCVF